MAPDISNGLNGHPATDDSNAELWRHPDPTSTQMHAFKERVNVKYGLKLDHYEELHKWSVENISDFWGEVWDFTGIKGNRVDEPVLPPNAPMYPRPDFFPTTTLNFAENLLYPSSSPDPSSPAIIEANETSSHPISWADLRERVRRCTLALQSLSLAPGDRVAGFLGNTANAVVAALAAASIGVVWTGVSPDTGVHAVLERLVQIEPKVLFVDNGVGYNGRTHASGVKARGIVEGLRGKGLMAVVVFETVVGLECGVEELAEVMDEGAKAWEYKDFVDSVPNPSAPQTFTPLPSSHPLYILYSSGTTGAPKCIVHSALGTLIQHKKEHIIHGDLLPSSRLLYYTTTTWMMWHWLVSALSVGSTIVVYDGSPFRPAGEMSMPYLIDSLKITHFGTSAKYLSILEQKHTQPLLPQPDGSNAASLATLKAIYSTGSPLAPSTYKYIYANFPPTVQLASITGGTDIISLFGAPNPLLPVYVGEIQGPALGLSLLAVSPTGDPVAPSEPGDLVATVPFPAQPTTFFGAKGDAKYFDAYFAVFPKVWHHADFISFVPHTDAGRAGTNNAASGLLMLGRSDGTLKPAGVRFGSAEIYNILLAHFPEVSDAVCVGRRRAGDADETVLLFCMMAPGETWSEELGARIKREIGTRLSARHVPGVVCEGGGVPVTGNGKKVEVAVKRVVSGVEGGVGESVVNREVLEWYREWAGKN
ncbi:hypothetical protein VE01_01681 [Pseudogymnoascus verrucosus]|uniref:AMP-dependent synthetase/ligase domain-containing protein n=1 Tax=Pseudogymnoascus verrucosus TaxID=342668 RepID=A0A1B8GWD1_9PEZI|nr:uncharacterized protein VE01_01681 [Pseudogymnoascus verrucosus]OBU00137.1 hypothetical protein VE01_01681 [Pseudogymnoascus verrucosus]